MGRLETKAQDSAYHSSWSRRERIGVLLWTIVWALLFRPSPKPLNRWRLFLLKCFGAGIKGRPFVYSSARIKMPWRLSMEDHACIGPWVDVYNLGGVMLREGCTISQEVLLCGGTHDLSNRRLPLMVGRIEVGAHAFVGARALVLPGISIGREAVVGAGSVVTKDVPENVVVGGNPARRIGERRFQEDMQ